MRSVSSVFSTLFLQLLAVRITLSCRARPLQGDSHHNTSHCTFHNTLFKELLGLLINYGAIIRQPRRRDVFKNQPRKWVTRRCEAACRPFTSFFLFFLKSAHTRAHLHARFTLNQAADGWRTPSEHRAVVWGFHSPCQFGNRRSARMPGVVISVRLTPFGLVSNMKWLIFHHAFLRCSKELGRHFNMLTYLVSSNTACGKISVSQSCQNLFFWFDFSLIFFFHCSISYQS